MKMVVIGGGPGGYVAAIRAAQMGAEVTLIERQKMGGTCLNVGCIPTKSLLHVAELFEEIKQGNDIGVMAVPKLDISKVRAYKTSVVTRLVGGVNGLMKANGIKVLQGEAKFISLNKLAVNGEEVSFERAIIATGSKPFIPPIPGVNAQQCMSSTEALELKDIPKSLLIIGGGVIGVEMATLYQSFGTKVTIVEMMPQILPKMDYEMSSMLRKSLEKRGIHILTEASVKSIENYGKTVCSLVEKKEKTERIETEKILVAVGRKAETDGLGLEVVGIENSKGRIVVDERQQTSVDGIYAIGDCIGGSMLAHTASMQGEVAAENAMGVYRIYEAKTNPSCVYTTPEFAGVGLTEEEAKESGVNYQVGRFPLIANGKSLLIGGEGMVKVIAEKEYGEILGVHILGPRATDMIAEGALAIGTEATLDELISTIHAHPTVSEAVREAALAAAGRPIHISLQYNLH